MNDLRVVRWRTYGKDRLYVNGPDDERLGWCDLLTGDVTVEDEADRAAVQAAVDAWTLGPGSAAPAPSATPAAVGATDVAPAGSEAEEPEPEPETSGVPVPALSEVAVSHDSALRAESAASNWSDLAERRAGQAAREQAVALKEAAPVRTFLARVLGVHTEERAWRIGADGEERVAARLDRLVRQDPRWRVLHAVPVGDNGSDIDHVVIGPAGVFTLNSKHHPGAKIWVGGSTFMVNGQRQPYVRNSRHEAQRAARLLTAASGVALDVVGVVVPVGADEVVVKSPPEGVHVVNRRALVKWLQRQPERLDVGAVDRIYEAARRSTTWRAAR